MLSFWILPNGLAALAFLAGALHVLAPDHWVPSSLLAWRRSWTLRRRSRFAAGVLIAHVLGGVLLFALSRAVLTAAGAGPDRIFSVLVALVAAMGGLRILRFSRLGPLQGSSPESGLWNFVEVVAMIGPAETLVPLLWRAQTTGFSLVAVSVVYGVATLLSGLVCVLGGPIVWNRPDWLPRGIAWAGSRRVAFPIVAGVSLSVAYWLRTG